MLFCLIVPIISEFQNFKNSDKVLVNRNHINTNHILASSGYIGQQVQYTVEDDSATITISGYGPTNNYKDSTNEYSPIYKGYSYKVKNIKIENGTTYLGDYLFYYLRYLKSIEMPDSIESIGNSCFYKCESLTSITIPDSVKSIGHSCFYNCKSLTSFIVPNQILSLNSSQFYNCYNLESVIAMDKLESIGDQCFKNCIMLKTYDFKNIKALGNSTFENCTCLTSISLPKCESIDISCFQNCTYLTSISLPKCESIGISCFQNCTNLESITLSESILVLEQSCFKACSSLQSIVIPNSVTSLGDSCFENCSNLQYIDIPDNVISIGNSCFFNCINILKISFGEKVEIIGSTIVSFCYKLNTIEISENNHNIVMHEKMIFNKDFSSLLLAPRNLYSISLPSNLTSIPEYAFCDCTNLTKIEIPDNITTIGKYAFYKCINLKEVKLPSNLLSISNYSFCHCHKLESIIIPNSVQSIGKSAFSYCRYLKKLAFGDELSVIGPDAFKSCNLISSLFVSEKNENFLLYNEIVYYKNGTEIILIPNNFTNDEIVFHENLTVIKEFQFYDNDKLKSISFGPKLTDIQKSAFRYCKNLISVTFNNCSVKLNYYAFQGCVNLKEVNFINVNYFAVFHSIHIFSNCINLQSIRIPDGARAIANCVFKNCIGLQSVEFPNSLIQIAQEAFFNCSSLSSITLHDNLTQINSGAFGYCSNLKSVIFGPNIRLQGFDCMFYMCDKLMNITVPEENKNIKIYGEIFYNQDYSNLFFVPPVLKNANIKFHENLFIIGSYHFKNNDCIKSLEFGPKLRKISLYAFENCNNLESVYFENSEIGCVLTKCCFFNCNKLKSIIFGIQMYSICEFAFHNCSIETISIHDNISFNYGNPFTLCDKLVSIIVPENSTKYVFSDGILYSKDYTYIYFGLSRQSEFNFHEGVYSIENYAFANNTHLKSIVIPESSKSIKTGIFHFCVDLTSVTIPNTFDKETMIRFCQRSFEGCIKLKEFIVSEDNPYLSLYEGCIYSKDFTELVGVPPAINEIKFHQNLQIIETYAFQNMNIRNIVFPENLIKISYYSFYKCSQLSSITFNDKVRIIEEYSFEYDIQLNGTLRLPSSVELIKKGAFSMTSFSEIIFDGIKQPSCQNGFINYNLDNQLPHVSAKVPIQYNDESFCQLDIIYDIEKENHPPEEEEETVSPTAIIEPTSITTLEPTISVIPLPTPAPEVIVDFDASSDLNETELDQELYSKFQSLSGETDKNQVVIIKNINNLKYNTTLKENQYIKPVADSHIDFIGGQLNVVLPDKGIVTVKINEESETKLSIKGEGEIKIEKADEIKKSINITSNSQINGTVTINVDDSIEKVFIDSIEFESKSTIVVKKENDNENKKKVELTVNTVTTSLNTNSTLTNVVVRELIRVFQSSTINIENTNIESAAVECNLFDYKDKNGAAKPTLKGVFNTPPKSLVLNYISQNKEDPIIDQDYTIVSGTFESGKCLNDWLPVIRYGNTKFNFSSCIDNNVLSLDNQRIVVKEACSFPLEENNSSKLTAGQIAGIVIGCVVVVAAVIAIVIYFVIKKRSSISKDEDESDESISAVAM